MFVPKKVIKKNKLILQLIVIGILLSGSIIVFYRYYVANLELKAPETSIPGELHKSFVLEKNDIIPEKIKEIEKVEKIEEVVKKPAIIAPLIKEKNKIIDTSIFDDPKFQALEENSSPSPQEFEAGKRNPFEL